MAKPLTLLIVSDIHYACDREKARGRYESKAASNPAFRLLIKFFRHFVWLRDPFAHNHLLDRVVNPPEESDWVVANGDFSCDSAFVGVMDDAACQSAAECLGALRNRFGDRFLATFGDHELGKTSLSGGRGGLRLASWHRAIDELKLRPFWKLRLGKRVLVGVASSVVAMPVYELEALPEERTGWDEIRKAHMAEIEAGFAGLKPDDKVLLFCHDPTALPFLWENETVRAKIGQIERTVIGHLHTNILLWKSRMFAGMPPIHCAGVALRRMTSALNQARHWKHFRVLLCPSLAGIQLRRSGGYYLARLDPDGVEPLRFEFQKIPW